MSGQLLISIYDSLFQIHQLWQKQHNNMTSVTLHGCHGTLCIKSELLELQACVAVVAQGSVAPGSCIRVGAPPPLQCHYPAYLAINTLTTTCWWPS